MLAEAKNSVAYTCVYGGEPSRCGDYSMREAADLEVLKANQVWEKAFTDIRILATAKKTSIDEGKIFKNAREFAQRKYDGLGKNFYSETRPQGWDEERILLGKEGWFF